MKTLLVLSATVVLFVACSDIENKAYQTKLSNGRTVAWDTKGCVWRDTNNGWPVEIDLDSDGGWPLDLFDVCWRENRQHRDEEEKERRARLPKVLRP